MGKIVAALCRARLKGDVLTIHLGVTLGNDALTTRVSKEKIAIKPLYSSPVDGNVFLGEITSEHSDESVIGKYTESLIVEFQGVAPYRYVVLLAHDDRSRGLEVCTVAAVEWDGQS
ncbi:MAG: hypothetical protein AMXMBFR56_61900 [Polyangiaceae bacterium]